jgi:hypothetical protein
MLVRALGYTRINGQAISYPTGYLATASSNTVALIGNHVGTDNFNLLENGVSPTATITRNDMGMLLYNFLLTNRFERTLVAGVSGLVQTVDNFTPVINNFGIQRTTGYITAVQNYATRLDVRDYLRPGNNPTFTGTPITRRQANPVAGTRNAIEIEISYGYYDNADVFTTSRILTTFDELGWPAPSLLEQRQLLGLKVDVFRHTSATAAARATALPASVRAGTITLVNNAANSADAPARNTGSEADRIRRMEIETVNRLTLGTGAGTAALEFDQRTLNGRAKDLDLRFNLYAFTDHGFLVSDNGNKYHSRIWNTIPRVIPAVQASGSTAAVPEQTIQGRRFLDDPILGHDADDTYEHATGVVRFVPDRNTPVNDRPVEHVMKGTRLTLGEDSIERELARFVEGNDAHYELYFVDNGFDARGNPEFFYVFVPYRVQVITSDQTQSWTGRVDLGGETRFDRFENLVGTGNVDRAAAPPHFMREGDRADLARYDAFVFTRFGHEYVDLVIKEKLAQSQAVVSSVVGPEVSFVGTALAPLRFTFQTTGRLAIGAWQGFDTNDVATRLGYGLRVYTDSKGNVLLMDRSDSTMTRPATTGGDWSYAFAMGTGTAAWVGGTTVYALPIFDSETNRRANILVGYDGFGYVSGSFIAYRGTGDVKEVRRVVMPIDPVGSFDNGFTVLDNQEALARAGVDDRPDRRYGVFADTNPVRHSQSINAQSIEDRVNFNMFVNSTTRTLDIGHGNTGGFVPDTELIATTGRTGLTMAGSNDTTPTFGRANGRTIINSTTRVIAVSDTNRGENSVPNVATFAWNNIPTNIVKGIGFIARDPGREDAGNAVRVAEIVFIYVQGDLASTANVENYATVLSRPGTTAVPAGHTTRYAQVYGTGQIIQVYSNESDMLRPGTVVTIGAEDERGLYRAGWIGSTGGSETRPVTFPVGTTGTPTTVRDRLASTLLRNSGGGNSHEDVMNAIQHTLIAGFDRTAGTLDVAPALTNLINAIATPASATSLNSSLVVVSSYVDNRISDAIWNGLSDDVGDNSRQAAVANAIRSAISIPTAAGDILNEAERDTIRLRIVNAAMPNVLTAFDRLADVIAGNAPGTNNAGAMRNTSIVGATTITHIGQVRGLNPGVGMFVNDAQLHLTADMNSFRTIFVSERPGTDGAGFAAGNPLSWTLGNSRVAHRNADETWTPVITGNDRVSVDNIWAVVTTDLTNNVLAVTLIVSPPLGRDVYRYLPWRR